LVGINCLLRTSLLLVAAQLIETDYLCKRCRVHISALALLKMAMHAKSGGNIEVMGMLQGKVVGQAFIVVDAFALPVEGTETRVNAQTEAYEYMVDFAETTKVGRWPALLRCPALAPLHDACALLEPL
jgi:hypothetical protein